MQKKLVIALAALAALSLSGCRYVELRDGKIPAQYLPSAKPYLGAWKGRFHGRAGQLQLSLQGQLAQVAFTDGRRNDILGDTCGSRIGRLKGVDIASDERTVKSAFFEFSPGRCRAEGRTLELELTRDRTIVARIVESSYTVPGHEICRPVGPIENGGETCHSTPDTTHYNYLSGAFRR